MIYLLQVAALPYFKIGFSDSPVELRCKQLQIGCPLPLRVCATIPGSQKEERALHQEFQEHRTCGEWFLGAPVVVRRLSEVFGITLGRFEALDRVAAGLMFEQSVERVHTTRDELRKAVDQANDALRDIDMCLERLDRDAVLDAVHSERYVSGDWFDETNRRVSELLKGSR